MLQIHSDDQVGFLHEVWSEYGVGTLILLLRFAVRIKTVGLRGFQGDDFFSFFVLIFWTVDAVVVHVIYYLGTNVDIAPERLPSLTEADIHQLTVGSKLEVVAWYSYITLIWCMKGTMLCFFERLTIGLWQAKMVKWMKIICAVLYIPVLLTVTFGCWPYENNWRVIPFASIECGLKKQNFIVTTVFNVITDAGILLIPLPLLWKLKVPVQKKLVIAILLCSGIFVITAAIIRVVFSLAASPSALLVNGWGVRETLVGIITINLPILRPLFNRSFWSLQSFKSTSISHGQGTHGLYELSSSGKSKPTGKSLGSTDDNGSADYIMGKLEEGRPRNEVLVSTTYQVHSEDVDERSLGVRDYAGARSGNTVVVEGKSRV